MQQERFKFVRNENTKNEHTGGIKRKKIWRKSKWKSLSSSNFLHSCTYISVLTSTETCTQKLNETFSFFSFIWKIVPPPFSTLFSSSLSIRNKSSHRRCSIEKAALKKFATFTEKHLCCSHFWIKLQVWRPATLLKRVSNKGVFLWIMGHFKEDLFWITLQTTASVNNFKTFHL